MTEEFFLCACLRFRLLLAPSGRPSGLLWGTKAPVVASSAVASHCPLIMRSTLDNEFQIREALEDTCRLINAKEDVFEKALLALVLLSYIQPFTDGNKRTARISSNAILMAWGYCPISFRTVDSIDYKKAMLMFYEQNNIAAFKQIFIEQYEFAVKNYF